MSVPTVEHSQSELNASPVWVAERPEVMAELQAMHLEVVVTDFGALERKDYTGPASQKRLVGRALVVSVTGQTLDEQWRREIEVTDMKRPLSEPAIAVLGALASERARQGERLIRDIL